MEIRKELLNLVSIMSNSFRAAGLILGNGRSQTTANRSEGAGCDRGEKHVYGLDTTTTPGDDLLIIVVLLSLLLGGSPPGGTTFALLSRAVVGAIVSKLLVRGGNFVVRHLCEKEPRMNPTLCR